MASAVNRVLATTSYLLKYLVSADPVHSMITGDYSGYYFCGDDAALYGVKTAYVWLIPVQAKLYTRYAQFQSFGGCYGSRLLN